MTPNSAQVTSNHEFNMADGVPDIFSILFSFFLGFSDIFSGCCILASLYVDCFWSSCWESNFRAFRAAHEISQCFLLCGHFFSFFGHGPDGIPLNLGIADIIEDELPKLVYPLTKVTVWSHRMFLKWMVNGE